MIISIMGLEGKLMTKSAKNANIAYYYVINSSDDYNF